MNDAHDILLAPPMPLWAIQVLLFVVFVLHFVFALLTVGLGLIGVASYVRVQWLRRAPVRAPKPILEDWFIHKSLAAVLGVGVLLLVLAGHPVPFGTAANLMAPLWLGLIGLLLAALLLIEWLSHHAERRRRRDLVLGVAGAACLVAVPAVFAAVVVTLENPQRWPEVFSLGRLPGDLLWHWGVRTLHAIAAAVIVALAALWWKSRREEADHHASASGLARALVLATLIQIVLGLLLYLSLPHEPTDAVRGFIVAGAALAVLLVSAVHRATGEHRGFRSRHILALVLLTVLVMLGARQILQDRVLVPMHQRLAANAEEHRRMLAAAPDRSVGSFLGVPHSGGLTIYEQSCSYCHGTVGNGQGDEAPRLIVPPEDLTELRTSPKHLRRVLRRGVDGTGMPRFGFYTESELGELANLLRHMGWRAAVEPAPEIEPNSVRAARHYFDSTCAACHGVAGKGSAFGRFLRPPPPDLTRLTYSPRRLISIITDGYPGTAMKGYGELDPELRHGLVAHVVALYREPGE